MFVGILFYMLVSSVLLCLEGLNGTKLFAMELGSKVSSGTVVGLR